MHLGNIPYNYLQPVSAWDSRLRYSIKVTSTSCITIQCLLTVTVPRISRHEYEFFSGRSHNIVQTLAHYTSIEIDSNGTAESCHFLLSITKSFLSQQLWSRVHVYKIQKLQREPCCCYTSIWRAGQSCPVYFQSQLRFLMDRCSCRFQVWFEVWNSSPLRFLSCEIRFLLIKVTSHKVQIQSTRTVPCTSTIVPAHVRIAQKVL